MQSNPRTWEPFPDLGWVRGGFSRRSHGGMSWNGNSAVQVVENRTAYMARQGLALEWCVGAEQVHGDRISIVTEADCRRGATDPDTRLPATDGLITRTPGVILTTLHADCAPVFFADPLNRSVGLAHVGWRSAVAGLPGKMLRRLAKEFHSRPASVRIAVGPMISEERYPVDDEVATAFRQEFGDTVLAMRDGNAHLDLFAVIVRDLEHAAGFPITALERPPCTASDSGYWSFRRDGADARSMMAWLTITTG